MEKETHSPSPEIDIKATIEKIKSMSKEDFQQLLDSRGPSCSPDSCQAQCQGMGHCERAQEFRRDVFGIEGCEVLSMLGQNKIAEEE